MLPLPLNSFQSVPSGKVGVMELNDQQRKELEEFSEYLSKRADLFSSPNMTEYYAKFFLFLSKPPISYELL